MDWTSEVQKFVSEAAFLDKESDLAWEIWSNMVDHRFMMEELVYQCCGEAIKEKLEALRSMQRLIDLQLQQYAVEVMELEF